MNVSEIEITGDPEIIEIRNSEAVVQMTFHVNFKAHLSYSDSSTGVWDSEAGRMMFMEERQEDVERDDEFIVDVHVTYQGADPKSFEIDQIELTEPREGYAIKTQDAADWPYK